MGIRTLQVDDLEKELRDLRAEEYEADGNVEEYDAERLEDLEAIDTQLGLDGRFAGETLIDVSDFREYAQELADDLGLTDTAEWPLYCIDWEHAASELAMDYTAVELDGTDWLVQV